MRIVALAMMLAFLSIPGAEAQQVDLTEIDAHIRSGFSLDWVFHLPLPGDSEWTRIPASKGSRPISIDLERTAIDRKGFAELFPPIGMKDESRYCVLLPFNASERLLASSGGVGLYLGEIGQNWQVYLNGYLIRDETFFNREGFIRIERSVHGALIQLDARWLRKGSNVLAFMVAGNPSDPLSGLSADGPYVIDSYEALLQTKAESLRLMIIGIYAFFALYHAVMYALRPKSKAFLFYGLGTMVLAIFLFSRTFIVYDMVRDTRLIRGLEAASLFILLPVFMAFFDAVLGRRASLFAKIYGSGTAIAAIVQFFFWRDAFVLLWRLTVALPVAYIAVTDIIIPLVKSIRHYVHLSGGKFWLKALLKGMARSDASMLLFGSVIVGGAVLLDTLGLKAGGSLSFTEIGFLLLVFGTAGVLATQFILVYRRVENLRDDLERRVDARSRELAANLSEGEMLSSRLSETSARLSSAAGVAEKDLKIATQVQQGFFPKQAPVTAAWDLAYAFLPASGISGDFYDFYLRGDRLDGLVVGDVSGHGIASGLITVLARSIFYRNFYERKHRSLGAVLEAINDELIPELSSVENFITAVLLRQDDDGRVEYASAAHTEILYRGAEKIRAVPLRPREGTEYKGPPLGREGIVSPYTSIRFSLKSGDAILIYTDGLDESRSVDGEAFGMAGVLSSFSSAPAGDASQMLDYIMQEWRYHVSGTKVADDTTVVLFKKT